MSYVRFSSDNFKSDVYVYESDDGFVVYVASNRLKPGCNPSDENAYDKIDLENAGTYRVYDTPGEAADWLRELADEGFYIPDGVCDILDEEHLEREAQEA